MKLRARKALSSLPVDFSLRQGPVTPGLEGLAARVFVERADGSREEIPAQVGYRPDDAHPGKRKRGRRT